MEHHNDDLYVRLGLNKDANHEAVVKSFRIYTQEYLRITMRLPFTVYEEAEEQHAQLKEAYEILEDPFERYMYDTAGLDAVVKFRKEQKSKLSESNRENLGKNSLQQLSNTGFSNNNESPISVLCNGELEPTRKLSVDKSETFLRQCALNAKMNIDINLNFLLQQLYEESYKSVKQELFERQPYLIKALSYLDKPEDNHHFKRRIVEFYFDFSQKLLDAKNYNEAEEVNAALMHYYMK